ncbi:hypothetical protein RFI_39961 [Reticulomyxa filosa]|uniref:Uncharacterized protein n=1 Tax=Reticulomyxa filosa TaxID=46433 RepID=X6L8Y5_RETFI|nr:hypothetical protein RFI_39961 [Reticulomyxa filosa]|eukprot:ETN97571.1 hypothetical protein RFI_39961 [Reticulomyxa filosa]
MFDEPQQKVLSMIQTAYVVHRCRLITDSLLENLNREMKEQKKLQFSESMKSKEIFDLFVAHLQREFSVENLVACMEMYT